MYKEIVISHFLHSLLKQVEVGRVGVERVSEVAMVTEGREGEWEGERERGKDGREVSIKILYYTVPVLCYVM